MPRSACARASRKAAIVIIPCEIGCIGRKGNGSIIPLAGPGGMHWRGSRKFFIVLRKCKRTFRDRKIVFPPRL